MLDFIAIESTNNAGQVFRYPTEGHRIYLAPAMIGAIENAPPFKSRDLIEPQPTAYLYLVRPLGGMGGGLSCFRVHGIAGSIAMKVAGMLRQPV